MNYFNDYQNVYMLIIRIFSVGMLSNSLEYLSLFPQFKDGGIFSYRVLQFNMLKTPSALNSAALFSEKGVLMMISVRLLASLTLFIFPLKAFSVCLVLLIAVVSFVFRIRNTIGGDGSDQMHAIVLIILSISLLFPSQKIMQLGLYVICAQAIISYVGAGVPKLRSVKWRKGLAVAQIMNTNAYGNAYLATFFNKMPRPFNYAVNWVVILFETLFFLVLLPHGPWCYALLLAAVLFHLYNVFVMGLNNFFWAFVMTYPAIIYSNLMLAQYMAAHHIGL